MRIKVYQIDHDKDTKGVKFCGLQETLKEAGSVNPGIYQNVFDGEVDCGSLEEVYEKFNLDHPIGFRGHSLAVSDVVEIYEHPEGNLSGTFFCDSVGFQKIEFDTSQTTVADGIRVLVVEPQKEPYIATILDDYRDFQKAVGGNFECTFPFDDDGTVIYSNEEAKLIGMEGNRTICGELYAGPFVIARDNGDGTTGSLTDEQISKYSEMFKEVEHYTAEDVEGSIYMGFISF